MTKTTKTPTKKITKTTKNTVDVVTIDAERQTNHDMLVAAFVVSVTLNFFIVATWVALNTIQSEAATLSVILGQ